jgi:hypothetical protein
MKPTKGNFMSQNPVYEAIGSIVIVGAALVVANYADKALIAGVKKVLPAMKISKLSKVKS